MNELEKLGMLLTFGFVGLALVIGMYIQLVADMVLR